MVSTQLRVPVPEHARPLKIIIAGGGIGGLAAAISLRQAGHIVEVFESSRFARELGAAASIPPNCNGLLRRLGLIPEKYGAVDCEWISEYRPDGSQVQLRDLQPLTALFPYPWQLIHRVDLHNALKDLAVSTDTKGIPVAINLQARVVSVDTEAPSITLEDGSTHIADLVIGADGIHSAVRKFVIKGDSVAMPSGASAFRFLVPKSVIAADPATCHFLERDGEMRHFRGKDRRLIVYPCRNNTLLNFVAIYLDEQSTQQTELWGQKVSLDNLLGVFKSFPDDILSIFSKAGPEGVTHWKLLDHPELGKGNWNSGKVTLLGDAAHPFLPYQGQGAAQAIEDACALGALLPLGTGIEDIDHRLELYTEARYDRATAIQSASRTTALGSVGTSTSNERYNPLKFMMFNFMHDSYDSTSAILKRDLEKNAVVKRMPFGFGPNPGPRQSFDGRARGPPKASKKTGWMQFKTPKSYLQTLLPNDNFLIDTNDGWATATFTATKLENIEWLGGRGFTFFEFRIHDVVYNDPSDPTKITQPKGDFVPVIFENQADSILSGREELGFPKVYATLDDKSTVSEYKLSAGWEGTEFCQMNITEFEESDSAQVGDEPLTLHYKVIASSKDSSSVDSEYVNIARPAPSNKDEKILRGKVARIDFTTLESNLLELTFPTLAHIVNGLRAIRVTDTISCGVKYSI